MGNEIELKLHIAEGGIRRLLRSSLLAAITQKKLATRRLISTYYDTPDHRLRDHGFAVRLRQIGGKWLQTVKTEGRVIAGLHERPEWETETAPNTFDFSRMQDANLKSQLEKILDGESLQAVFTTEFTRLSRELQFGDGTQCEFSLDRGKIIAGTYAIDISELELEILNGDVQRLFEFAQRLLLEVPVTLAHESKAARGFALALGVQPKPIKATQAVLDKQMNAQQGFVAIASACVQQLTANETGCVLGEDAEFLHQMRVAIRRLRTAIRLFADFLDSEKILVIVDELRWLGGQLGGTRDLDVFLEETLPPIFSAWPNRDDLAALSAKAFEQRAMAAAMSKAAIQSARYQRLLLDLGAWLIAIAKTSDGESIKLVAFARDALKRHRKQLIRRAEHLLELSAEERHRVRISGKRLRYAAEFFAPLFPAKKSKPYIQELAHLQSILGVLNDVATTKTILARIADETNGATVELIQAWVLGAAQGHMAHLAQAHERFLRQQTFW